MPQTLAPAVGKTPQPPTASSAQVETVVAELHEVEPTVQVPSGQRQAVVPAAHV